MKPIAESSLYSLAHLSLVLALALALSLAHPAPAASGGDKPPAPSPRARVLALVTSPPLASLYARTYASLLIRIGPDGFFPESLTGAYAGMFPRTVGGLVSLFLLTGELDASQRLLDVVLSAASTSELCRIPHVIGPKGSTPPPLCGQPLVQVAHPTALYRLDNGYYAAQYFTAPDRPIRAFEAFLLLTGCTGKLTLAVHSHRARPPLYLQQYDVASLASGWTVLKLKTPLNLEKGRRYDFSLAFHGTGRPLWCGLANAAGHPLAGTYAHDADTPLDAFLDHPDHVTAFAVDTGHLKHARPKAFYPVLCDLDQVDGQAHVLLAWARLAERRGPTPFEDRTWPLVARLMDRTIAPPYVLPQGTPLGLGLVHNFAFEHSREGRFWDCWDLLTQAFVSAALESLIPIARRRGDWARAARWQAAYDRLQQAIRRYLTGDLDGERIYLEMRLPDGGSGKPFLGLSWVNFAPVAAQWRGLDLGLMRHTVSALRKRALHTWHGHAWLAAEWGPRPDYYSRQVIGKEIGWETAWCLRTDDWTRLAQLLDFVCAVQPPDSIFMEAANLGPDDTWRLQDPGNGEQCSWWCWGMALLREKLGLPPAPENSPGL